LSAIAKFLIHFFREEEGRAEMREGRSRGKEWGRKAEGQIMGMHEKNSPKAQQIWHLGTPLGGYRYVSYVFEKMF